MKDAIVRIISIELINFKNVEYGLIEMPAKMEKTFFSYSSDILGIYGQNGSGKTAVIEAMGIVQRLWQGLSIKNDSLNFINKKASSSCITVQLTIDSDREKYLVTYFVELLKTNNDLLISKEKIEYSTYDSKKFNSKKILLDYNNSEKNFVIRPKYRFDELIKINQKNNTKLEIAKTLSQRNICSFIFSEDGRDIFINENNKKEYEIIKLLYIYSRSNLFVITKAHSNIISMDLLPFAFRLNSEHKITKGDLAIELDKPSTINLKEYEILIQLLKQMNTILKKIIPDLTISIHEFGEELLQNNTVGKRIELISKKGDIEIPLKYESEGIIKIISILNVLMCIYNNPSMCLIIDELDAGIFEYLLGELVSIFEEGAKGQLLFTSHNLRILEKVDKKSIMFSTINPKNRYIHFKNVKRNNNLRDTYIRCILLGGQKEGICEETDSVEIGRAFRDIRRKSND